MRILIHSNACHVPAAYGQQTAQVAPRMAALGHDVAISAFCGINATMSEWNGLPVYPAGLEPYGGDVLPGHARHFGADFVLTIMDAWVLGAAPLKGLKAACWLPVDCTPLSLMDQQVLSESGAVPVAVSEFGRDRLQDAGFAPLYVPHGIETSVFAPQDKTAAREAMSIPLGAWVIGINGTNLDAVRKSFSEQFTAFAMFRKNHPEAMLLVHAQHSGYGAAIDLRELATRLGVAEAVRWTDQYRYACGAFTPEEMATWYACLDLLSGCSHAEGFGLPLAEAQLCGVPVVTTNHSAMPEVAGPLAQVVGGEPFWNARHRAFWSKPRVHEIAAAYEKAYVTSVKPEALREHAMRYDADRVFTEYWEPALKELEAA